MVREHRWLILIFSLYILLALGYSLLMPIWEAPDEPAHYHLAWRLARTGQYAPYEINYEAYQPRTFYYIGSWIIRALDKIDPELSHYYMPKEIRQNIRIPEHRFEWSDENYRFLLGVYALRWLNILFGGMALWLNWKAFHLLTPHQPTLRLAALAVAALIPQYLHIMSSVNNDALGTLAGALLFYLAVRLTVHPSPLLGLLSLVLAVLLPLLTKLTVLPVSAAILVIVIWRWTLGFPQKRLLLFAGLAALAGAGIFYLFFPQTIQLAMSELNWRLFSLRKNALTFRYIKLIGSQIVWTFWGKVGWLAVGLHFWIVNVLTALGIIGMLLNVRKLVQSRTSDPQFNLWLSTWLIATFTILAVARNGLTTYATQGRFLFPAIGALSILMVSGWHNMLPEWIRLYLPLILIILMLICTWTLWQFGVLPVYYQPLLD